MNESIAITIGISFYNAESTLLDAIRSVFAQTHENWELILVDDGSTDDSLELAKSIKDPRIRVYSDGKNVRLAARLNQLTKLAKHNFIARMDADDLMSPVRLEKQLELLLSKPNVDLISTGMCSLSDDYEPVGIRCVTKEHLITATGLLSGGSGILHGSLLGRRAWFESNPYKESMLKSQDTNLWVRSYSKNNLHVDFIREPLYYYREDGNVSKKQLLLAYSMGRHTIINDAKARFSLRNRTRALSRNLARTCFVKLFSGVGALRIVRGRRNAAPLDMLIKENIKSEISYIRSINLPITKNDRGV